MPLFTILLLTLLSCLFVHRFHGFGIYIFVNGERYEGELRDGAKHG